MREGTATIGWLSAIDYPRRAWPGVLLHRDAFLVRVPREVLVEVSKLWVSLSAGVDADRIGQLRHGESLSGQDAAGPLSTECLPVLSACVLEVDGWADEPAPVMVRLAVDSGVDVATEINRAGFELAVRVTGDVWKAFESLGLVPDDLYDLGPVSDRQTPATRRQSGIRPSAAAGSVQTIPSRTASKRSLSIPTVAVGPASWCDIFWWLC
ncbi:MAG: hypothetical protein ABWZ98_11885 [Nakamurella sp.]